MARLDARAGVDGVLGAGGTMDRAQERMSPVDGEDAHRHLIRIKLIHTLAWAFFVASIIGVWVSAWDARFTWFLVFVGIVMVEVVILLFNGMQCPLTPIAARYTTDRRPNFDIYLPQWLAKHNKTIFGSLFVLGLVYGIVRFANLP